MHLRVPMKTLLASILLIFAACGGKSKSTESPTGGSNEPAVDPTVPSWLPQTCHAYQKAVVQAIACQAIDQTKRDDIQKTFDATSASWKTEDNADKARVEVVGANCVTATESVRADIGDKCV